jgi:segregation and condensation protein B
VTFATTEMFLERLGLSSLSDLPDIAPLLPDIDLIDDISESLDTEPRFARLNGGTANAQDELPGIEMDKDE